MSHWPQDEKDTPFAGVLVLGTGGAELTEQGRVAVTPHGQEGWGEGPSRTLVIGDDLWTLDHQGLARFDLQTLRGGWVVDL